MQEYVCVALEAQKTGTAFPFVIVNHTAGKIVGMTRYHSVVPQHRRIEIGFSCVSIPWQRTIVNTESKYLLLRHAFEELHCVRVEFKANAANEQSRRALLRIGAKQEGILRCYRVGSSGATFDLAIFSIVAPEWPHISPTLE